MASGTSVSTSVRRRPAHPSGELATLQDTNTLAIDDGAGFAIDDGAGFDENGDAFQDTLNESMLTLEDGTDFDKDGDAFQDTLDETTFEECTGTALGTFASHLARIVTSTWSPTMAGNTASVGEASSSTTASVGEASSSTTAMPGTMF